MCVRAVCMHTFTYILLFQANSLLSIFSSHQVQSSIGKQSQLVFLHALLGQQKKRPMAEVLATLEEALDVHATSVKVWTNKNYIEDVYIVICSNMYIELCGHLTCKHVLLSVCTFSKICNILYIQHPYFQMSKFCLLPSHTYMYMYKHDIVYVFFYRVPL